MHKILCVEDAPEVLLILENVLRGYDYLFATNLKQAQELLARTQFSLVLLDIELPDGNAFEFMANSGEKFRGAQVIFLTGRKDLASKASAFSLGADDYIVKPFDPNELKLRVDAKLRKFAANANQLSIMRLGRLVCNLQEQRVFRGDTGQMIDLTFLEFRIFRLLAGAQNKIFSRHEILDRVWGHSISVTDRVVDVHISNLRKKLAGTGVTIEAVIGTGYRLDVDKSADKSAAAQTQNDSTTLPATSLT